MKSRIILFLGLFFGVNKIYAQVYEYDSNHQITQIRYANGITIIVQYDANGNRVQNTFISSSTCPGGMASFYTGVSATTYQWQVDAGTGFVNISNNSIYSGATTNSLILTNAPTSWYGYKYRCMIDGSAYSSEEVLKFVSTWFGSKNTAWENPENWGCNKVPDLNTDVVINGNALFFPVVNSNVSIRTLTTNLLSQVKVSSGFQLNILR